MVLERVELIIHVVFTCTLLSYALDATVIIQRACEQPVMTSPFLGPLITKRIKLSLK